MELRPSDHSSERLSPKQRLAVVAWVILGVTSYPWESSSYFTGAATGSQELKAALLVLALCLALIGFFSLEHSFARPLTPTVLVVGSAVISVIGAVLPNSSLVSASSNVVAAAKIVLVFVCAYLCARTVPAKTLWNALLAMVSGVMTLAVVETYVLAMPRYKGRMSLYHPAVPPNSIAIGAGIVILHFGVKWLLGRSISLVGVLGVLVSIVTLVGTGSRGALAAVGVGILAVALTSVLRPGRLGAVLLCMLGFVVAALVAAHGTPGQFVRPSQVGVLDSRSTIWSAVVHGNWTTGSWIFGNGANNSLVAIPFNGWASSAPVNNAWLMAFVQSGLIGVLALASYLVFVGRNILRTASDDRPIMLAIFAALCSWSITEAGMISVAINGIVLVALAYWSADNVAVTDDGGERSMSPGRRRTPRPSVEVGFGARPQGSPAGDTSVTTMTGLPLDIGATRSGVQSPPP